MTPEQRAEAISRSVIESFVKNGEFHSEQLTSSIVAAIREAEAAAYRRAIDAVSDGLQAAANAQQSITVAASNRAVIAAGRIKALLAAEPREQHPE